MTKSKVKINCPKCFSKNTILHGVNKSGNQVIYCKECMSYSTQRKPHKNILRCSYCGKMGIDYRKPDNLCKRCYYQRKRDENKIKIEIIKHSELIKMFNDLDWEDATTYLYCQIYRKGDNSKKITFKLLKKHLLKYQEELNLD